MKHLLSALLILTVFVSCTKEDTTPIPEPVDYTVQNEKEISDFITANNLTAQRSDTGLYYVIKEPGTGAQPTSTSNVTVAYKATFLNGQIFDQSSNDGVAIPLNQVIKGWSEGIPHFKEGGTGILLIPAHLGYGSYDYRGIPAGSVLIFEIKLISVN